MLALVGVIYAFQTYQSTVDTAKKQLRAYLGLETITLELPSARDPHYEPTPIKAGTIETDFVVLTIKNFGSTPALQVTARANWKSLPFLHQPPLDFTFPDLDQNVPKELDLITSKTVVDPSESWITRVAIHDITPFLKAARKKSSLYIYGHIDYTDIYGKDHHSNFCYVYQPYEPRLPDLIPYSSHNEAD